MTGNGSKTLTKRIAPVGRNPWNESLPITLAPRGYVSAHHLDSLLDLLQTYTWLLCDASMAANETTTSPIRFGFTDAAESQAAWAARERQMVLMFHNITEGNASDDKASSAMNQYAVTTLKNKTADGSSSLQTPAPKLPSMDSDQDVSGEGPDSKKRRTESNADDAASHGGASEKVSDADEKGGSKMKESLSLTFLLPWLTDLKLQGYANAVQVWIEEYGPCDLNEVH